jgi:hypothetical protein
MSKKQRQSLLQLDSRFVQDLVRDPSNLRRLNREDKQIVLSHIQMNIGQMEWMSNNDKDLLIAALLEDILRLEHENDKSFFGMVYDLGLFFKNTIFFIFSPIRALYSDLQYHFITKGRLDLADGLIRLGGYASFAFCFCILATFAILFVRYCLAFIIR